MQVYITTNKINGKIYIGQNISDNDNYFGSGIKINWAFEEYGAENFTKEILRECSSKEEMDIYEAKYIKDFDSTNPKIGYNVLKGINTKRNVKKERAEKAQVRGKDGYKRVSILLPEAAIYMLEINNYHGEKIGKILGAVAIKQSVNAYYSEEHFEKVDEKPIKTSGDQEFLAWFKYQNALKDSWNKPKEKRALDQIVISKILKHFENNNIIKAEQVHALFDAVGVGGYTKGYHDKNTVWDIIEILFPYDDILKGWIK